jgi:hypothetical protein
VNSAAMIGAFKIMTSLSLDIYPKMRLMDHMVDLRFIFEELHTVFYHDYIILHSNQQCAGFPSHNLLKTFYFSFFNFLVFLKIKAIIIGSG